jgi:hypothetical protein
MLTHYPEMTEAVNPVDSFRFLIRLGGRTHFKDFAAMPSLVDPRQT